MTHIKKYEKYILFIFLFFSDFAPNYYRGFKLLFRFPSHPEFPDSSKEIAQLATRQLLENFK
jgi:hypothetical protein